MVGCQLLTVTLFGAHDSPTSKAGDTTAVKAFQDGDGGGDDENQLTQNNTSNGDSGTTAIATANEPDSSSSNSKKRHHGKRSSRDLEVVFAESRERWSAAKSMPARDLFDVCRALVAMRNAYRTTRRQRQGQSARQQSPTAAEDEWELDSASSAAATAAEQRLRSEIALVNKNAWIDTLSDARTEVALFQSCLENMTVVSTLQRALGTGQTGGELGDIQVDCLQIDALEDAVQQAREMEQRGHAYPATQQMIESAVIVLDLRKAVAVLRESGWDALRAEVTRVHLNGGHTTLHPAVHREVQRLVLEVDARRCAMALVSSREWFVCLFVCLFVGLLVCLFWVCYVCC
jgi:hypothetical protein